MRYPYCRPAGDTGHNDGKLYAVNVPLQEGMDDESYKYVYEPVMQKVRASPCHVIHVV